MKDKIISALIGALIGGLFVFGYGHFFGATNTSPVPGFGVNGGGQNFVRGGDMDLSQMSDMQLQTIADRAKISLEELKSKIDAGEDISNLMRPDQPGQGFGVASERTGSGFSQSGTGTFESDSQGQLPETDSGAQVSESF